MDAPYSTQKMEKKRKNNGSIIIRNGYKPSVYKGLGRIMNEKRMKKKRKILK